MVLTLPQPRPLFVPSMMVPPVSGEFLDCAIWGPMYGAWGPAALSLAAADRLYFIPRIHPYPTTLDRIGLAVTTTGSTLARCGVYTNRNSRPHLLLADSGDIDLSSGALGSHLATISLRLEAWTPYWEAVVFSATSTTALHQNNFAAGAALPCPVATTVGSGRSYYMSHTYGALPADVSAASFTYDGRVFRILTRVA